MMTTGTVKPLLWGGGGGTGGRETGRKGGGRHTGGGRRGGGKRDSQGGGEREKKEKLRSIAQYFAIEKMQRGGSQKIQGGKPGLKGTGSGRFKPPCPPVHSPSLWALKDLSYGHLRYANPWVLVRI